MSKESLLRDTQITIDHIMAKPHAEWSDLPPRTSARDRAHNAWLRIGMYQVRELARSARFDQTPELDAEYASLLAGEGFDAFWQQQERKRAERDVHEFWTARHVAGTPHTEAGLAVALLEFRGKSEEEQKRLLVIGARELKPPRTSMHAMHAATSGDVPHPGLSRGERKAALLNAVDPGYTGKPCISCNAAPGIGHFSDCSVNR
jgi:hypothetical protein